MLYDTTPTNDLIDQAAEMYVSAMGELSIPVACALTTKGEPRRTVMEMHPDHCTAVMHAITFWRNDAVAAPLMAAHLAAHDLMTVSMARADAGFPGDSPFEVAARAEVKRLRAIIAEKEAGIQRALREIQERLVRDLMGM
ncbi:hypothetical protein AB0I81_30040 [Nonomuraea sp. NPDC050404]|uniref:hypothetical protein n=1 Tax=Nonomuraea sp. NPDC050404 TaxID=3155783 RepID=UPI0033F7AEE4